MRETESRTKSRSRVETAAQLHPTLAASLEFSEHYGQNWDAITSDRPPAASRRDVGGAAGSTASGVNARGKQAEDIARRRRVDSPLSACGGHPPTLSAAPSPR